MQAASRRRNLRIPPRQFAFDAGKFQFQGRESLSGTVVQVARDAPAFIILHAQQAHGKIAQILIALLKLRRLLAYAELQMCA